MIHAHAADANGKGECFKSRFFVIFSLEKIPYQVSRECSCSRIKVQLGPPFYSLSFHLAKLYKTDIAVLSSTDLILGKASLLHYTEQESKYINRE